MITAGIDIGTCNSCCYTFNGHTSRPIRTVPSVVTYGSQGSAVGGSKRAANTIYEFKRVIGRAHTDKELWQHARNWSFVIVRDGDGVAFQIRRGDRPETISPSELYRTMIRHLMRGAGAVDHVTLTVPAHFNHRQRELVRQACDHASVSIVNEPTAAALAYMGVQNMTGNHWLVFDIGAGTTDVTLLTRSSGSRIVVMGSRGHEHLGGSDFDQLLMDSFVKMAKTKHRRNLRTHKAIMATLREGCEEAKCLLTTNPEATIVLDDIAMTVGRDEFEALLRPKLNALSTLVWDLINECDVDPGDVDHVLLVGGCSRVPAIRLMLEEIFASDKIRQDIDPDECVAMGAARYCKPEKDEEEETTADGKNTTKADEEEPTKADGKNTTKADEEEPTKADEEEPTKADEEEPTKAGWLVADDVVPATLGVQTYRGEMTPLLRRNTRLPAEHTETFYPLMRDQPYVDIRVYQGECDLTSDNRHVATLRLLLSASTTDRIPIQVTFRMDRHGMIHVDATSRSSSLTRCVLVD